MTVAGTSLQRHRDSIKDDIATKWARRHGRAPETGSTTEVPSYLKTMNEAAAGLETAMRALKGRRYDLASAVLLGLFTLDLSAVAGKGTSSRECSEGFMILLGKILKLAASEEVDPQMAGSLLELLRTAQVRSQYAVVAERLTGEPPLPPEVFSDGSDVGRMLLTPPRDQRSLEESLVIRAARKEHVDDPGQVPIDLKRMWSEGRHLSPYRGAAYAGWALAATADVFDARPEPAVQRFRSADFIGNPGGVDRRIDPYLSASSRAIELAQRARVAEEAGGIAADLMAGPPHLVGSTAARSSPPA